MNTRIVQFGLLATVALTLTHSAIAQSVNVGAGQLVADHYLLGATMRGGGVSLTFRTPIRRLDLNVGFDRYNGTAGRVGVVCAGLIKPGTCTENEAIRDQATMYLLSVGPSYNLVRTREFTLSLLGHVQGGSVNADTYGLQTGRTLDARRTLWGVAGGLCAGWKPSPTKPIVLQGTASVGRLGPVQQSGVVDGYEPFDGRSFRTQRVSLGVAYLVGRGR